MKNLEFPGNSRNPVLTIAISEMGKQAVMEIKKNVVRHSDYYSIPNLDFQTDVVSSIKKKMKEEAQLHHYKLVIIIAGLGEELVIQAVTIIAQCAKILAVQVIVFAPVPLVQSIGKASKWLQSIANFDLFVAIPIHNLADQTTWHADYQLVMSAYNTIISIGTGIGIIKIDFADLLSATRNKGIAYVLQGHSSGENRTLNAIITNAIKQLELLPIQFNKAKSLIMRIVSKSDEISLLELCELLDHVLEISHEDSELLWNCYYDSTLKEDVTITLIIAEFN